MAAGVAFEAVVLFGFAGITDSHVLPPSLVADKSVFVDGTKSVTGNEEGVPFLRMADSFQGQYDQGDTGNKYVKYPRSLGPITGLGDPTYDQSEGLATDEVVRQVREAKGDKDYRQGVDTIYVVGYSQGAGGAVNAIPLLEDPEFAKDKIEFVLAANPRRNDGGLLTRLPAGVYLPIFGVTFGGGTTPKDAKVLQVTKQYDGVGDAPNYLFNVAADVNAVMGFYYLHSGYYRTVDPTADPTDPTKIVTTTPDGLVTDVLIKAPDGELPLTMPLRQLGVPEDVVKALDPFLRAVIETGYNRPDPTVQGSYPDKPVPFQLVPPPTRWLHDVQSVAGGGALTTQRLAALGQPTTSNKHGSNDLTPFAAAGPTDPKIEPELEDQGDEPPKTGATPTATGTGPNKVSPPQRPKSGWKPGDLLRSLFGPKPANGTGTTSTPAPGGEPSTPATGPAEARDPAGTSPGTPAGSTAPAA